MLSPILQLHVLSELCQENRHLCIYLTQKILNARYWMHSE